MTQSTPDDTQGPAVQGGGDAASGSVPATPAAPQRTPEKDPSEWATGGEPATGPQLSYLSTLAQEAGVEVPENPTKADASKLIDELQQKTGRGAKPNGG
jgi:hypothetical protein